MPPRRPMKPGSDQEPQQEGERREAQPDQQEPVGLLTSADDLKRMGIVSATVLPFIKPVRTPDQLAVEEEIHKFALADEFTAATTAKDTAKRLGVTVAYLKKERAKFASSFAPPPAEEVEIEPWPHPVATEEMLELLYHALGQTVILKPEAMNAVVTWVCHSYVYKPFRFTPRLLISAPEHESGKSALGDYLTGLCYRGEKLDEISSAAFTRLVDRRAPTLCLDEIDAYFKFDDLRGAINGGYASTGRKMILVRVGDNWEEKNLSTFCPVSIAGIRAITRLPSTIRSRSVPILMQRKELTQEVIGLSEMEDETNTLKRKLTRWANDHPDLAMKRTMTAREFGSDRKLQVCRVLMAIADDAGPWGNRLVDSLLALFDAAKNYVDKQSEGVLLLGDIRDVFIYRPEDHSYRKWGISSSNLVEHLHALEDRPWGDFKRGGKLTERALADLLRQYEIGPGRINPPHVRQFRGYREAMFETAWRLYLKPPEDIIDGEEDDAE